jgi:hypothetical protein
MDESSNTSPKKIVYLVYIELATDGCIPFFWQTETWLGIDRELTRRGLEGIANRGVHALRFGLPGVMHLDGSILLE